MSSKEKKSTDADAQAARVTGYIQRMEIALQGIPLESVVELADTLTAARNRGAKVLICGNGGSASTASHYAIDWMFGSQLDNPALQVFNLSESSSNITATGNDLDFETVFTRNVMTLGVPGDILVVVSASGNSPNLLRAMEAAHDRGLKTVGITGFDGGVLRGMVDLSVHCPTEAEDYGVAEDLHLMIGHVVKELLLAVSGREQELFERREKS